MHQHNPFREFEYLPSQPERRHWARGMTGAVILIGATLAIGLAGYGLGRGAWAVPQSIAASIPAPLARWLPRRIAPPGGGIQPAELKGYAFELVEPQAKQGKAVLTVRLRHDPTGKPVPDALIFAHRLDMAPEGMPTMTAELKPQPSPEPGIYRFETDLTMEGGWRLSLAAKIQGEIGTVRNTLTLRAGP